MDALVLLDLLGAANPTISSFYPTTGWMFDQLADVERRLGAAGRLAELGEPAWAADKNGGVGSSWFRKRDASRTHVGGGISDDHLPFLKRGVEILHGSAHSPARRPTLLAVQLTLRRPYAPSVIASPFPTVWHTIRVRTGSCPCLFDPSLTSLPSSPLLPGRRVGPARALVQALGPHLPRLGRRVPRPRP